MDIVGIDAGTNECVKARLGQSIEGVERVATPAGKVPFLAPGWIDIQVNGYAGVDYNSPVTAHEQIARSLEMQFAAGVTRLYPTVITGEPERMLGAVRNLGRARENLVAGRAIEGLHIEGPHISREDGPRGAHPRESVREPDIDEYRRWQDASGGLVKLVTLSPEWPGAVRYIEALATDGVVAAIGHTNASSAQIEEAVRAGATMSTHLGNGSHTTIPRHSNYIFDQLAEDRLMASFIADGIHLPPAFLKVALRAKGVERSVLITDAVMPAGCAPGVYRLGAMEVELHPGDRVTLADTNQLAGSALRIDRGVANLVRIAGLSLSNAVAMATRNAARAGRIEGRQQGLTRGERGDLVVFDWDEETAAIEVRRTYLDGELIYEKS